MPHEKDLLNVAWVHASIYVDSYVFAGFTKWKKNTNVLRQLVAKIAA